MWKFFETRAKQLIHPSSYTSSLLKPLSLAYRSVMLCRNFAYEKGLFPSFTSSIPVTCVGNVIVGGSGKSPFVSYLVQNLLSKGKHPVILSRGYGGSFKYPHIVSEEDTAETVGDESLMHAGEFEDKVKVVVAKKRAEGAQFISDNKLGDTIVLDDGYQHQALNRKCNLLLLDISNSLAIEKWQKGSLLPAGFLREPLEAALKRASCVVFVERGANSEFDIEMSNSIPCLQNIPCFKFRLMPDYLVDVFSGDILSPIALANRNISAMTAIANPDSFFSMLTAMQANISNKFSFFDHYQYKRKDFDTAINSGYPVVTTKKDAVKLSHFVQSTGQLFVLVLKGDFVSEKDYEKFFSLVLSCIES